MSDASSVIKKPSRAAATAGHADTVLLIVNLIANLVGDVPAPPANDNAPLLMLNLPR